MKDARYILSIWVAWFFLTALYLALLVSKTQFAPVVGLFVPMGLLISLPQSMEDTRCALSTLG